MGDDQSVQAAITECHEWDGFNYRNLFLTLLEAGVLRLRGLQGQDCQILLVSSHGRKRVSSLASFFFFFNQGTNPVHEGPTFMT